jgi:hypothetical protein
MGVAVKAICSECLTMHYTKLDFGQENIKCPACGHSLKNLPEGELNAMETTLKKQRVLQVISLACFLVGAAAFFCWIFGQGPIQPGDDFMSTSGWPLLALAGLIATMVLGALGSRVRYIVEF